MDLNGQKLKVFKLRLKLNYIFLIILSFLILDLKNLKNLKKLNLIILSFLSFLIFLSFNLKKLNNFKLRLENFAI